MPACLLLRLLEVVPGDIIPVTLVFDNGMEKLVSFAVRKPE